MRPSLTRGIVCFLLISVTLSSSSGGAGKGPPAPPRTPESSSYVCAACNGPAHLKCTRCQQVHYCSKACQRMHWKEGHKDVCRAPESGDAGAAETANSGAGAKGARKGNQATPAPQDAGVTAALREWGATQRANLGPERFNEMMTQGTVQRACRGDWNAALDAWRVVAAVSPADAGPFNILRWDLTLKGAALDREMAVLHQLLMNIPQLSDLYSTEPARELMRVVGESIRARVALDGDDGIVGEVWDIHLGQAEYGGYSFVQTRNVEALPIHHHYGSSYSALDEATNAAATIQARGGAVPGVDGFGGSAPGYTPRFLYYLSLPASDITQQSREAVVAYLRVRALWGLPVELKVFNGNRHFGGPGECHTTIRVGANGEVEFLDRAQMADPANNTFLPALTDQEAAECVPQPLS